MSNDNNSKYDPAYCKELIEHRARGHSYPTFGAKIYVGFRTMRRWEKVYPEWAEAVELAELMCLYTWEELIIGQANGSVKGLPATTIFALKNYFPEKFKENSALAGSGNTIVVFDSGVPVKQIEGTTKSHSDSKTRPEIIEVLPSSRDALSLEGPSKRNNLPDFLNSGVPSGHDDV